MCSIRGHVLQQSQDSMRPQPVPVSPLPTVILLTHPAQRPQHPSCATRVPPGASGWMGPLLCKLPYRVLQSIPHPSQVSLIMLPWGGGGGKLGGKNVVSTLEPSSQK